MADTYCPDCKRQAEVVFDHSAGDTICSECGLILGTHSVDDTPEWRTFVNDPKEDNPVRVGEPYNPLLPNGGLSTVISKGNEPSSKHLTGSLYRCENKSGSNPDRSLVNAYVSISSLSERYNCVCVFFFFYVAVVDYDFGIEFVVLIVVVEWN